MMCISKSTRAALSALVVGIFLLREVDAMQDLFADINKLRSDGHNAKPSEVQPNTDNSWDDSNETLDSQGDSQLSVATDRTGRTTCISKASACNPEGEKDRKNMQDAYNMLLQQGASSNYGDVSSKPEEDKTDPRYVDFSSKPEEDKTDPRYIEYKSKFKWGDYIKYTSGNNELIGRVYRINFEAERAHNENKFMEYKAAYEKYSVRWLLKNNKNTHPDRKISEWGRKESKSTNKSVTNDKIKNSVHLTEQERKQAIRRIDDHFKKLYKAEKPKLDSRSSHRNTLFVDRRRMLPLTGHPRRF